MLNELGDGPPLVLVHGFMDNAALGADPGRARGRRRVIAVDLPGHRLAGPFDYAEADLQDVARTFVREVLRPLKLESAPSSAPRSGALSARSSRWTRRG